MGNQKNEGAALLPYQPAGQIIKGARQLVVRITHGHPSLKVLLEARQRIMELGYVSSG